MATRFLRKKALWATAVAIGLTPLAYFATVAIQTGQAKAEAGAAPTPSEAVQRTVDNVAFGVGETLNFDINYGFINAGTATMKVQQLIEYNQRPCYQIVTTANSNSFFSTFYRVEDRVESIFDAMALIPWRFEKRLREGNYRAERVCVFDQGAGVVQYQGDTIVVPAAVQDALSALYYVRTQELKVGGSVWVANFTDGKSYSLEVKILGRETVKVDAGQFDCLVVEPMTSSVGVFKNEGRLRVWLTDDRVKLPVLMKSKILIGSISAELTSYKLGDIDAF